jgi:diguanylate cyclase (GGDEF)-like protein
MPNTRFSIAVQLYLLIGVAALALVLVIAAAVTGSGRMLAAGERLHVRVVASVQDASQLALLFERQVGLVSRAPAEIDLQRQRDYRAAFEELNIQIEATRAQLEELVPPQALEEVRSLTESFAELRRQAALVFSLSSNFVQDKATDILDGPFAEAAKRVDTSVAGLLRTMRGQAQAEVDALNDVRRSLVFTIASVSVVAIGLVIVVGVLLIGSVSGRLRGITTAMTVISGGAGAGMEIPFTHDRDELGEMARALEVFRHHAEEIARLRLEQEQTLSALESANEQLRVQNVHFDAAVNNMSQALLMFDATERLLIANRRYYEMYGLSEDAIKPGNTLRELIQERQRGGQFMEDVDAYIAGLRATLALGETSSRIFDLPDGRTIVVINHPMAGGGWLATHEDITERRRAEAKISYMARHDALTDLPNRVFFQERLEQFISRKAEPLAVLSLDLDKFKAVNDTLGHPIGDQLLREAAARIRGCIREGDLAARLGGDEFAVLQPAVEQPQAVTALAKRLIEVVGAPYQLDCHQVVVAVSVGITVAPGDGTQPDALMKNADLALYRAKADGGGTYHFFEAEMDARMQARRALELDLRKALLNNEFELYYQPVITMQTGAISGFEALIRWHHPQRGMVAPAEFISLAEEIGLIVPIGEWVLRQACREAALWPPAMTVAVNLSPVHFKSRNLLPAVVAALAEAPLPANRLELEITETVLLQDTATTLATLRQLQDLGVTIAMDDFGTGYSSLSYLRSFPFDRIKIDQSFVRELSANPESTAIIRAVVGLGSSLGIAITAEGVETLEQLEHLRAEGCDAVQGYFFSHPRPASEIRGLMDGVVPEAKAVA